MVPVQQLPFATEFAGVPNQANDALCVDNQYYDSTPFQGAQQPTNVRKHGDGLTEGDAGRVSIGPAADPSADDGRSQTGDAVAPADTMRHLNPPGPAFDALQDRPPSSAHWDEHIAEKGADSSAQTAAAPVGEGNESVGRIP
jgi:hypothetical protein